MSEVVNSMKLSVTDQEIYDELLQASVKNNYSCYADGDTTTNIDTNKTMLKEPEYWLYNDKARLLDETAYFPSGKMRGVTITFRPDGKYNYVLKDGIINQMGVALTKKGPNAGKTLEDSMFTATYNRLRSIVGDSFKVSSQTYRNSDYTIFISMGTTGGNQETNQDAIQVWGQYNGTNLPEVAAPVAGGSQDSSGSGGDSGNQGGSGEGGQTTALTRPAGSDIPDGAVYKRGNTTLDKFPDTPATNDTYEEGDYKYTYNKGGDYGTKWYVAINTKVTDKNRSSYGEILSEVAGQPITSLCNTFQSCTSLTTAPTIPSSVINMYGTFANCTSLTDTIEVNANPTSWNNCFHSTVKPITLTGSSTKLTALAATTSQGNVTVK